jgi:hypothetical protein
MISCRNVTSLGSGETRLSKSMYRFIIEPVMISNGVLPMGSTADFGIVPQGAQTLARGKTFTRHQMFSSWVAKFICMQRDIFTAEMHGFDRTPWLCDDGSRR